MNELTYSASTRGGQSGEQYLESNVQTAAPERLRLMLIERGVEVSRTLARYWREGTAPGSNEWSIRLLDILNELLSGITGGKAAQEREVCNQVADLYVFLTKHLIAAEERSDAGAIDEIATVLEVEAETWRVVCAQATPTPTTLTSGQEGGSGLNLQA